jgi:hypothetical protein
MSSRIYLASQINREPKPGICALCGCNFELLSAAVVLYDGHLPLGDLCQECLLDGPGKAALKVRERAKKLYAYADEIRKSRVANQWIAIIQSARERAAYWDALAERVERLSSWDLKDSLSN